MKKLLALILAGAVIITFSGCNNKNEDKSVGKMYIIRGDNQYTLPNAKFSKQVIVELMSPVHPALFGGKGTRNPVGGVKVNFEALPGSDLKIECSNPTSDMGGMVRATVSAGSVVGDQYLKIYPESNPKLSKTIRLISGIKIKGLSQEGNIKSSLSKPISISITDKNSVPLSGVPVYFSLASTPESKKTKSKFSPSVAYTDESGVAQTNFKLGKSTGTYKILAEIASPKHNLFIRGIEINAMGIDAKGLIMTVLGGLALFIFGIKMMSDGLQLVAGEKMKKVLHFFTSNRFKALAAGTLVTGVIQSSSACTVMTVGFVNAGLLTLFQAIGIIFGANIGTTITAQMIAFKLGGMAMPAIIGGMIIIALAKKDFTRGWGNTLFGFGLLFFGMSIMKHELKLIGAFPSFLEFFKTFDCTPIDGGVPLMSVLGAIAIGTLMTTIIQSSSATIGITIALGVGGLINFYTALPLLLGCNIGTTCTAILATLGANKRAKQTALAHSLFNILGVSYMFALFFISYPGTDIPIYLYLVNTITQGNVFSEIPENIARHIAMSHTMFNVLNVILFIPFMGVIERICNTVIPIKEDEKVKLQYLESHLLNTPSIALEQTIQSIRYMMKESWSMISASMDEAFIPGKKNPELYEKLMKREDKIDNLQEEITSYLVQLTRKDLNEPQSEIIPLLMHCTNDAETIADISENIMGLAKRISKTDNKLSETGQKELRKVWKILSDQATHVISSLQNTDSSDIDVALKDEAEINLLTKQMEKEHINRLKSGKCDSVSGIIFLEIVAELEHIGDRFTNIAERAPEIQKHHLQLK
ncbi:MAG: Na/Pi symporter [Verrucomicrobiota bacterium]|nr:Na/Pi symporter [Verrucomicrobiota bacterium]